MLDYSGMIKKIEHRRGWKRALVLIGKWLPILEILLYLGTSVALTVHRSQKLRLFLAVPAFCLVAVTVIRARINRTRPYDALGYAPLLPKESGKGESFPSRHTASAWVIAMAYWYLSPVYGGLMLAAAVLVGVTRVLTGVHYLSDVLVGAGFALLCSLLFLLPV